MLWLISVSTNAALMGKNRTMANTLLNTDAGQVMLAALSTGDFVKQIFTDRQSFLNPDPWPLYVRYAGEKAVFVPRDRFYFQDPAGPSACLWIVPGTAA